MHVAFRADGGPEIGYGHLVRSGAIADAFIDRGHTVTCATTTADTARDVYPEDANLLTLDSNSTREQFTNWVGRHGVTAVITDSYHIDTDYQRRLRESTDCLAVILDDARHPIAADVFINANLYASTLTYEHVGSQPVWCLGPEYLPLRKEIRTHIQASPPWCDMPDRAIVTLGGSDTANLSPTIVRAFDGLDLAVDAIVGPGFSEPQEKAVRNAAESVSARVTVSRDPSDLAERMFLADFGVCTASTTTYELLALGTPLIAIPVVDNQQPIASVLGDRDLATVLDATADESSFKTAIDRYFCSPSLRCRRRKSGRELVDGRGSARIRETITAAVEKED